MPGKNKTSPGSTCSYCGRDNHIADHCQKKNRHDKQVKYLAEKEGNQLPNAIIRLSASLSTGKIPSASASSPVEQPELQETPASTPPLKKAAMEPESDRMGRKPRKTKARRKFDNNKAKKTSSEADDAGAGPSDSRGSQPSSADPATVLGAPDQKSPSADQVSKPSALDDRDKSSDLAAGLDSRVDLNDLRQQKRKSSFTGISMEETFPSVKEKEPTTEEEKAWWKRNKPTDPKQKPIKETPEFRHNSYADASHIFGAGKADPVQNNTSSEDQPGKKSSMPGEFPISAPSSAEKAKAPKAATSKPTPKAGASNAPKKPSVASGQSISKPVQETAAAGPSSPYTVPHFEAPATKAPDTAASQPTENGAVKGTSQGDAAQGPTPSGPSAPAPTVPKSPETTSQAAEQEPGPSGQDEEEFSDVDIADDDYGSDHEFDPYSWWDPIHYIPSRESLLWVLFCVFPAAFMFIIGSAAGKHNFGVENTYVNACLAFAAKSRLAEVVVWAVLYFVLLAVISACVAFVAAISYAAGLDLECISLLRNRIRTIMFAVVLPVVSGAYNSVHYGMLSTTSLYFYEHYYLVLSDICRSSNVKNLAKIATFSSLFFICIGLYLRFREWLWPQEAVKSSAEGPRETPLSPLRAMRSRFNLFKTRFRTAIRPAICDRFEGLKAMLPASHIHATRAPVGGIGAWLRAKKSLILKALLVALFGAMLGFVGSTHLGLVQFGSLYEKVAPSQMPAAFSTDYWKSVYNAPRTNTATLPIGAGSPGPTAHHTSVNSITVTTTATMRHTTKPKEAAPPPRSLTLTQLLERIANQSLALSKRALPLTPAPAALHAALQETRDAFPHYALSAEMSKYTDTSDKKAEARSWLKLLIRLDQASHKIVESFKGASIGFSHSVISAAEGPLMNIERYEATGSARGWRRKTSHASCNIYSGLCGSPREVLRKPELEAFVTSVFESIDYISFHGELTLQVAERASVLAEKIIKVNWEANNKAYDIRKQAKYAYKGLEKLSKQTTWSLSAPHRGRGLLHQYRLEGVFGLAQDMKKEVKAVLAMKEAMLPNLQAVVELLGKDLYGLDLARDWNTVGYRNHLARLVGELETAIDERTA